MNLIKTSLLTAVSTVLNVLTGIISTKVVAVYVGPPGVALIGQLGNFVNGVTAFSTGGTNAGVVKYVAEYFEDEEKRKKILSSAAVIALVCSLFLGISIVLLSKYLSVYLLRTDAYSGIFLVLGPTLVFVALNTLILSVLNGYKEIRKYISINIAFSFVGLIVTVALVVSIGLYGALLSMVVTPPIVFLLAIWSAGKSERFRLKTFFGGYDRESGIKLGKYGLMALVSAFVVPASQIIVRNYITDNISLDAAGHWQAVWRISDVYLMLVTTSLVTYYLPRLSEIQSDHELRKEILYGYKILLPITIASAAAIYLSRDLIIRVLFTEKFMPMKELFTFQLIGDVIKISSWILGYLTIAKAMTRVFIACEVGFTITFVLLSISFIKYFGLIGATYAFAVNYTGYLVTMLILFRKLLFARAV